MSTRDDIIETITRLFWHTDHHEWGAVEAVFAQRVHLDYTSLQGGEPAIATPQEIVDGWRRHFDAVPAHQHLVGNHLLQIDGERAHVRAQFIATHQYEDRIWTLGGDYEFRLEATSDGWRVDRMVMNATWQNPGPLLAARA